MNLDSKPRFYKRKTFYIPLLAFFILFLITIVLLYKPLKLLIWTAIEYPKEKEYLLNLINEVEEDNLQEFAKTYTIDTSNIDTALYYTKTAERDFIIAHYLGFGDDYIAGYNTALEATFKIVVLAGFIALCEKHNNYITPMNAQYLRTVKPKMLELLAHIDTFLQFLSKHQYFHDDAYKIIHAMRVFGIAPFLWFLHGNNEICSLKEKDILLQQMQKSYDALTTLKDKEVLENVAIYFESYDKMLKTLSDNMSKAKGYFNECK